MNIDYVKLSPTGNITVLVKTPVPRSLHGIVAARLLRADCVGGEQVGYVEGASRPGTDGRLQMMGGEFCGNATMSLGALVARGAGLADGAAADLSFEVSGSPGPVPCRIRRLGGAWVGTVSMPLPERVGEIVLDADGGPLAAPIVQMPGISHLILPAGAGLGEAQLRRRLPQWNRQIGADALGALLWDGAKQAIDPLVYVPSAGTLVREHGCGSGTAAVGCWLATQRGEPVQAEISQPGGVIEVKVTVKDGTITSLAITGKVEILEEGQVSIDV